MLVVLAGAVVGPAAAGSSPQGSGRDLFFASSTSGDPADAIVGGGFWGHEGPARAGATVVSTDLTEGADLDLDKFALVFTPTSADGTAEEPVVTAGQTIAEAYPYFTRTGFLAPVRGHPDPTEDQVLLVSTKAEWDDWVADGKPDQAASSNDLVLHDTGRPGMPVSEHPRGRSILNRWEAGLAMSAVIVATTGEYVDGVPVIDASSGRAEASWITFTSAIDPAVGDADHHGVATSGAYQLTVGAVPASGSITTTVLSLPAGPLSAREPTPLTAAVNPATAGTVEFRDGPESLGSTPVDPSGVAEWSWTATAGTHVLLAVFTPIDSGIWSGSSSTPTPVEVVPRGSRSVGSHTLAAGVPEDALTISTPYTPDHPLDLGQLVLSPDALTYAGSAPFAGVLVTDNREGALPWTLMAFATNLATGTRHTIDDQVVGLVDLVTDIRGPGTVEVSGLFTFAAPVSTSPGHYTGTVTFTVA